MAEETKEPKADEQQAASGQPQDDTGSRAETYTLPKIDFTTFVLSINSSALVQLGQLEDPAGGQKAKNIALAKQTIDILAMLEEKTQGNLTGDEENILKNILYELRMLYVKEKG